ncbi:hypothetical protein QQ008_16930 [Fulvivirgaceae bacterium BMA10]|uniref:DUF1574 domain-containing protein n=1 Tax=Splendidivirga corallicola TaxID=3051826 RepID=A0ABT8KQQ0_9BACT|nr:hypothetical protein [Fulvivirgaceae bacterium BMA10]
MKSYFIKFLMLLLIVTAIAYVIDMYLTHEFNKSNYYKPLWVDKFKNENFDFILLGNSRVYSTIDVEKLEKATGLKGLNLGLDGSNFASQLLMLKIFLENRNTTKRILFQVDPVVYNNYGEDEFSTYTFYPLLKRDYVFEHQKQFGFKYYLLRYIPMLRYAMFNFKWSPENFTKLKLNSWKPPFDSHGSLIHDENFKGPKLQNFLAEEFFENKYFNQIITLSKKQNIPITLFTAPYIAYNEKSGKVMQLFDQFIDKKGMEYHNYHNMFQGNYDLFYDNNHINAKGVALFNQHIATLLTPKRSQNLSATNP